MKKGPASAANGRRVLRLDRGAAFSSERRRFCGTNAKKEPSKEQNTPEMQGKIKILRFFRFF
jgi:hypothetical protein